MFGKFGGHSFEPQGSNGNVFKVALSAKPACRDIELPIGVEVTCAVLKSAEESVPFLCQLTLGELSQNTRRCGFLSRIVLCCKRVQS